MVLLGREGANEREGKESMVQEREVINEIDASFAIEGRVKVDASRDRKQSGH